ncbi:MAG: phosphoribosylformylglycinamidine synthase subunit PurL [Planctomycetes bacterium]|nr:phosphoribosylformylglycinamidine synthase subunit PurL [Planctomycetota bacterium]
MPDPKGQAVRREVESLGLDDPPSRVDTTSVYLIQGNLDESQIKRLAEEFLADPVTEESVIGTTPVRGEALIEIHPLPGVMDPDAEAVRYAIKVILGRDVEVRTGLRYDMYATSRESARQIAQRRLANTVIHAIHETPYHPDSFVIGTPQEHRIITIPIRDMDDETLATLSRQGHMFLSLDEMRAIQSEYRRLERDPKEIELETLAQTWSEHCIHKTLKATIRYEECLGGGEEGSWKIDFRGRPGHEVNDDGSVIIHNLLKSTIIAATDALIADGIDWCLSVFVDNAGVIAFDDNHAVCFKVETHNHPSAIEPYGGAATGIGGCIRDVIGTGLAARPIAATDVFCVAHPDHWTQTGEPNRRKIPTGILHPRRILTQIVEGVRDYGNRMGIPTLNGAVWFDNDYVGNPLVYCGCIGVMPRDKVTGEPRAGDHIIALGGRTGRDGIHGATFSSAELTDTHALEFSHAVQIGNAVTEKKMLDAIIEARDYGDGCLFSAITDCGAGGFSSAVGEMGEKLGAQVHLERAPLKYEGLSPSEIWISEAQERMVLAVPSENIKPLREICDGHDVEMCDLGTFGTENRQLILNYEGQEVGRLDMAFLHDGLPETIREAKWSSEAKDILSQKDIENADAESGGASAAPESVSDALLALLAHPNIASKHWIIRQYDHEVQGRSVVTPFAGSEGHGPSDAAVITPVYGSTRGLGIANGLATGMRDDPYVMTLAAIDECVRNLVCVGVDPKRIAILDNFCWPSCDDPRYLGALVRAAEACYDGAMAYRTPFISGKDSLNNQFTTKDGRIIKIPPTLLISGFGIVPDIRKCVTMDAKESGNLLIIAGMTDAGMGGSHYNMLFASAAESGRLPGVDLTRWSQTAHVVHQLIEEGLVRSAHDCSDGGMLCAASEMAFAGGLGLRLDLLQIPTTGEPADFAAHFAETPGRYLLEVSRKNLDRIDAILGDVPYAIIGEFNDSDRLTLESAEVDLELDTLKQAWRRTLDW